ncbi:hypothetical protein GQ44DRAFT_24951 [Phaeosphaeriaceae sp. PMI808]|nr:hypothetical protein GQ44DRAFT_24951 [Phaeosphaeriaceae sp. PMI808]
MHRIEVVHLFFALLVIPPELCLKSCGVSLSYTCLVLGSPICISVSPTEKTMGARGGRWTCISSTRGDKQSADPSEASNWIHNYANRLHPRHLPREKPSSTYIVHIYGPHWGSPSALHNVDIQKKTTRKCKVMVHNCLLWLT